MSEGYLPLLPAEINYLIFYQLTAKAAAALCQTSKEFSVFCTDRKLRVATLMRYYLYEKDSNATFLKLLRQGKNAKDVEHIEALARLNPSRLDFTSDRSDPYTLEVAEDPLIITALLQLGSNPLVPYKLASSMLSVYDPKYVEDGAVPLVYLLSQHPPPTRFLLCMRYLPPSTPSSLKEVMATKYNAKDMVHLPNNSQQVQVNLLCALAPLIDNYLLVRELLEAGIDPLAPNTLYQADYGTKSALYQALDAQAHSNILLMLHYVSVEIEELKSYFWPVYDSLLASYMSVEGIVEASKRIDFALKLDYPILLYLHDKYANPYWDDLSFWQSKWRLDLWEEVLPNSSTGGELRLAYRALITKAKLVLALNNKEKSVRVNQEELKGLITTLFLLDYPYGIKQSRVLGRSIFLTVDTRSVSYETVTSLPYRAYTAIITERRIQFDNLDFLRGAVRACRLVGFEPSKHISSLQEVVFK